MSTNLIDDVLRRIPVPPVGELVGISHLFANGLIDVLHPKKYLIIDKTLPDIRNDVDTVVICIPGFTGPGTTMVWLAEQIELHSAGRVQAITWGDHANIGPFPHIINHLAELIDHVAASGKKIVLVGHSLGGVYVDYFMEKYPDIISGGVMLGSPVETTPETLAEATSLVAAAKLLSNDTLQLLLHEEILERWDNPTKTHSSGFRFGVSGSYDAIVYSFASVLEETKLTRNVIVKSDHCGLITHGLVPRMIAGIVTTGDVHTEFSDSVNKHILTLDDLDKINGLPEYIRLAHHLGRGHRNRMRKLFGALENVRETGEEALASSPLRNLPGLRSVIHEPTSPDALILPHGVVPITAARSHRDAAGRDPRVITKIPS